MYPFRSFIVLTLLIQLTATTSAQEWKYETTEHASNFALKNLEAGPTKFLLKVTSMGGKLMRQASFEDAFFELDIADFPPGTYAYQIINQVDQSDFLTGRFVKVR